MINISIASNENDLNSVKKLTAQYINWTLTQAEKEYGFFVNEDEAYERAVSEFPIFQNSSGRILLATDNDNAVGIAFLKKLKEDTCEIKRVFVLPECRGHKLGARLMDRLIQEASEIGYEKILLDTAKFMTAAHKIYYGRGFKEIPPYPESEYGADIEKSLIFMELIL
jgi:N-acetylglutamate synthase-like GNAT family acetyltransferase